MTLCPRCQKNHYTPYPDYKGEPPPPPALSRVAKVDVCSDCGLDEALRDAQRLPPIPPDEWPVASLPTFGDEE